MNFEHDSRTVEIDLDPNSIRNHLLDSVRNWDSRKTELYFESESLLKILESMIIDNYMGRALSHVPVGAREVSAASWSFVRSLQMLLSYKVLLSLLIALELSLYINLTFKVKMAEMLFEEKELSSTQNQKSLLNHSLVLDIKETQSYLGVIFCKNHPDSPYL